MTYRLSLLLAMFFFAVAGNAQAWHEGFETDQTTWQESANPRCQVLQHQRVRNEAYGQRGSEWIQFNAEPDVALNLAHDVGRPAVIEDLSPSVWVKSDTGSVQIALRVALPRTIDPKSGRPMQTVLRGEFYTDNGRWQQLKMQGLPRLLTRQVHLLRMQYGPNVDEREAYVEAVVLCLYGGAGTANVWIDDLDITGHVVSRAGSNALAASAQGNDVAGPPGANAPILPGSGNDFAVERIPALPPASEGVVQAGLTPVRLPPVSMKPPPSAPPRHTVKLDRSFLLVDERPIFPRVIQHRGEPLGVLKRLGFNTVWLQGPPAPEVLEEAARLDFWLICPPPRPGPEGMADISPAYDSVLAWDLGLDLITSDLDATQRWAEQVREADRRGHRPLICLPRTDLRGFSRAANILLIDRRPLNTSFDIADYAAWVRRQPKLASLGTPIWTTVQTQPNAPLCRQLAALMPGCPVPASVPHEQIELLAYTAVASGSRGLVFASDGPLDATDPETQRRALSLQLLNLQLEPIEPWAAAGQFVATAEATDPEVTGAVLHAQRARLLLPLWFSPGAQCVPSQSAANALSLIAPGVPETSGAFELTPNGARPLDHQRVTGGMRVTLDEFGLSSQILLAHDPTIISAVHRRAAQVGRQAAELQRQLAIMKFESVRAVAGQLAARSNVAQAGSWFDLARKNLQTCDAQLAAGDAPGAAIHAQRAERALRLIERAYWDDAVRNIVAPVASPGALNFTTLPCHWQLVDRLSAGGFSPNRIDGGDFEDMGVMLRAGWRYILQPASTVTTAVDLVPQAAHSGRQGVRLVVAPAEPKNPPAAIESPPILFVSPAVQAEEGQLICIHGWVRVNGDIGASNDGLLIVDSLSGECLADRIGRTNGWRQFALYRAATQTGPVSVTFALSGLGEAWIDDVAIQVIDGRR